MPRSLVSQAGPLAMRRALVADATYLKRSLCSGKRSSSKRTRAINIRYFFLTDQIEKDNLEIKYLPTKLMIGDFFTKPLQGKQFKSKCFVD
jgi:hypothetical protein